MVWDKHKAVNYARLNANAHSQSRCAHFVSNAIRHGGLRIPNTNEAKDMGPTLIAAGFRQVYGEPQEGDIAVIQAIENHPHGHVCIYDGHGTWYSDFVQRTMYPGPGYRAAKPSFTLYRHN